MIQCSTAAPLCAPSAVPDLAFLGLLATAAGADLRTRRIPNALTIGGASVGLLLSLLAGGGAIGVSLAGAGLAMLLSLPLWALGSLGGGDAKLLIAVGTFLGAGQLLVAAVLTAIAGGVMALVVAIRCGALVETVRNVHELVLYLASFGTRGRPRTLAMPGGITVPYGVAIAIGAGLAGLAT